MKEQEIHSTDGYKLTIEAAPEEEKAAPMEGQAEPQQKAGEIKREKKENREKEERRKKDDEREQKEEIGQGEDNEEEMPTLKEVIMEQAKQEDTPFSPTLTLKKILGGDILYTSTIRKQIWLFLLITVFLFIYIANRYSCQKSLIEIDHLQKELLDAKYKSLSSNSQITEKSRESNVLERLRTNKDSTLRMPNQPPYIINVPTE